MLLAAVGSAVAWFLVVTNVFAATGLITATPDNFTANPIKSSTGGRTASVLSNDALKGNIPNNTDVTLTLSGNGGLTGATLNSDGTVDVSQNAAPGTYILNYQICSVANLQNVFSSGFETGDLSEWSTSSSGPTSVLSASGTAAHAGSYGVHIKETSPGIATYVRQIISPTDDMHVSGWYRSLTDSGSAGSNNAGGPRVLSSGTRVADVYRQDVSGAIWLRTRRGDGTFQFTNTGVTRPLNTWYNAELRVHYKGPGAVSTVTVTIDGTQLINDTARDLYSGAINMVQVGHETPSTYADLEADDIKVEDMTIDNCASSTAVLAVSDAASSNTTDNRQLPTAPNTGFVAPPAANLLPVVVLGTASLGALVLARKSSRS